MELEKSSGVPDWAGMVGVIAGPLLPSDTRESWIARAARRAGITYRQCRSLFYGETVDPRHSVGAKVLSAADRARIEAARRDGGQIATIYENTAAALASIDPDFHRQHIDALVAAARIVGALDRP